MQHNLKTCRLINSVRQTNKTSSVSLENLDMLRDRYINYI